MNILVRKNHKKTVPFCDLVPGDVFLLSPSELKHQDQVHVYLKIEEVPGSMYAGCYGETLNMVDLTTNKVGYLCEPSKEVICIEKEDIKFEICY